MPMTTQYLKTHQFQQSYTSHTLTPCPRYTNKKGWTDIVVDDHLIYSHRDTYYTPKTFTEGLHTHDYYELLIYICGDVEYIRNNTLIKPTPYSVIWFLPGEMHTARLRSASRYERYVLYFSNDFFTHNGTVIPMTDFMQHHQSSALLPSHISADEISSLLQKADAATQTPAAFSGLLIKAYLTEIFGILNKPDLTITTGETLTEEIMKVKNYIDKKYAVIPSTTAIAEHFHYSREHLSRKFKDSFNISISDYLAKRRITESLSLLSQMRGADAAYAVGFRSQSAYISAFVKNMGCLPSEYKRSGRKQ